MPKIRVVGANADTTFDHEAIVESRYSERGERIGQGRSPIEVLEHEAAHLVAAIHVRAAIHHVRLMKPNTRHPARRGTYAEVHLACLTDEDDALVNLAGVAWEALTPNGRLDQAGADFDLGRRFAAAGGHQFEDLLDESMRFIDSHSQAVRALARTMLVRMPRSGLLQGRTLHLCLDEVRPSVPIRATLGGKPVVASRWC